MAFPARILATIGLAAAVVSPVAAQTASPGAAQATPGQLGGLRYLNWSGKRPTLVRTPPPAADATRGQTPSPSTAVFYGPPGLAARAGNGLTPASAWLPAAAPPTVSVAPAGPVAVAMAAPVAAAAVVMTPEVPARSPIQPARADDALRPDAPIFGLAREDALATPATPVQPRAPAPPQGAVAGASPRFYSVHRAAGRTPDPVVLPAPVMLEQAPVDLAEPEGPPLVLRDSRGRLVPAEVPDGSTLP